MRIKTIFTFILFCISLGVYSQNTKNCKCFNFDDTIENPDSVYCLTIDLSIETLKDARTNLKKFKNLNQVIILEMKKSDLEIFESIKNISSLKIANSPELNLNELANNLKSDTLLKELILESNEIREIPKSFEKLSSLEKLIISDNEELDIEQTVELISKMSKIKYLGLPINEITDLPKNIGKLNQIEVLDISNNYISSLPSSMKTMNKLDTLFTEGNVFISPEKDLNKLKSLKIKYISLDESTDSETLNKLYEIFPNSKIELKKAEEISPKIVTPLPDSVSFSFAKKTDTITTEVIDYGQFKIEDSDVFIYSDAYSRYPSFFFEEENKLNFDTLFFDQRFRSLNYTNNGRTQPFTVGGIKFAYYKHNNKKSSFYFYCDPRFVTYDYWELGAYSGVKWVYKGELKKRKFKKKFIGKRRKPIAWRDTKIIPNEGFKDYSIILKGNNKFDTIVCYPFLSGTSDEEVGYSKFQKALMKRYLKYVKSRSKRANRHDAGVFSQLSKYKATIEKAQNEKWAMFQKLYMSAEEQKMSYKEWMKYYDLILQDEAKAVLNAEPSTGTTIRALKINGYKEAPITSYINDTSSTANLQVKFSCSEKKALSLKKITVINKTQNSFYSSNSSSGNGAYTLIFPKADEVTIVIESLIGEIAVITSEELKSKMNTDKFITLNSVLLNPKIATVSQIFNILKL